MECRRAINTIGIGLELTSTHARRMKVKCPFPIQCARIFHFSFHHWKTLWSSWWICYQPANGLPDHWNVSDLANIQVRLKSNPNLCEVLSLVCVAFRLDRMGVRGIHNSMKDRRMDVMLSIPIHRICKWVNGWVHEEICCWQTDECRMNHKWRIKGSTATDCQRPVGFYQRGVV